MGNVIFSKFSNERKSKYGIVTKIVDCDGKRVVVKESLSREADEHIKKMAVNQERLSDYFCAPDVVITSCTGIDEHSVSFEYIDGVRYDELVEKKIASGDHQGLQKMLGHLKAAMLDVRGLEPFQVSEGFARVFGTHDYELLSGKQSFRISNIDMIFGNIIVKDEKYYITDYEWVFDFPVPVSYVLYRSLLLDGAISKMDAAIKKELLQTLEISQEEISLYHMMETEFQKYVSGKNIFDEYKKTTKNRIFRIQEVPEDIIGKYCDIYLLDAEDKKEFVRRVTYPGNRIDIRHDIACETENILFELSADGAIFKISKIAAEMMGKQISDIEYTTNADLVINNDYYFKNKNPEICIKNKGYDKVEVQLDIYYENTTLIAGYVDEILSGADMKKQLAEKERDLILRDGDIKYKDEMIEAQDKRIHELENEITAVGNEIAAMKSTRTWRMYERYVAFKEKHGKS
ncbi:MAG: hypothetical protein SPF70_06725 [Lachnospiraceae bacterium]|nr:hypothetical protein [Lachnospiraceae bacterium]